MKAFDKSRINEKWKQTNNRLYILGKNEVFGLEEVVDSLDIR